MIGNYLKIAIRNLLRHKGYSLINIAGLAIGMATAILILLFIEDELSYDAYHHNADRIVRVASRIYENDRLAEDASSLPFPIGPTLQTDFPQITVVRFFRLFQQFPLLKYEDREYYEKKFCFADSTVFQVFNFELLKGNPETALVDPFSVVITESMAEKYFGDTDPVGKLLRFENVIDMHVTGVMRDVPGNSHFEFDFLGSFNGLDEVLVSTGTPEGWIESWYWNPCWTYALLPEGYSATQFESDLGQFFEKNYPDRIKAFASVTFYVQPLKDIHLTSHLYNEIKANSDSAYIYIFSGVALFVLLIACINFMNLSTSRSANRAREVGLRKVVGANRITVIYQFIGESLLLAVIAFAFALILAEIMLPIFNDLSGKSISLKMIADNHLVAYLILIVVLTGMLSGVYPACFLSSFQPIKVLKGIWKMGGSGSLLRKILVVFQFSLSIFLIIATIIMYNQLDYIHNRDMGFDQDQMLIIPIRGTSASGEKYQAIKDELLTYSQIKGVTATSDLIGQKVEIKPLVVEGDEEDQVLQWSLLFTDHDFIDTYGVKIAQGRDFSREYPSDDSIAFIINETAARVLQWDEPVGQRVIAAGGIGRVDGRVIGVVKDFNYAPIHQPIKPLVIKILPTWRDLMSIKISTAEVQPSIGIVEKVWKKHCPERPLDYFFLDSEFDSIYRAEEKLEQIFQYFSALAIFISCLGLLGLASYTTEQRTKEIGIRKALGASVTSIVTLLTREYVFLIVTANILTWPFAWYAMSRWLDNFAYRIDINVSVFLVAGVTALLIALATVSYQAIKASICNPVQTLRYE